MALDPSCQRFLRILSVAAGSGATAGDVRSKRESFEALLKLGGGPAPERSDVHDGVLLTAAGLLTLRIYRPRVPSPKEWPTCLFFHGGGFIAGSIETHDGICRNIAEASACQIISVGYRLAPENAFPAQVDDAVAALTALTTDLPRFRADAQRIAVGGDSVGAGLAALLCQIWQDRGSAPIALQVLICPALDPNPRFSSREEFARGYYIEDHMIAEDFAAYRGTRSDVPTVFDRASFEGLPPAIIHVSECDPFRDEGLAYGERLRGAGVAAEVTNHPGMIHLFHAFGKFIPAGQVALLEIGAQMGARLRGIAPC